MDKLFILQFAFKNLLSHKLRSILTLTGIVIGISAIVFLVSFAFGIERLVTNEVSSGDAFKLIDVGTGNSQVVKLDKEAIGNLTQLSESKKVDYTINIAAKVKEEDRTMDVALFGTSANYLSWSGLEPRYGKASFNSTNRGVMVNKSFCEFLGTKTLEDAIGQKIKLDFVIPKESTDLLESTNVADQEFEIIAVFDNDSSPNAYIERQYLEDQGIVNFSQVKIEMKSRDKVQELRSQVESMGFKTQYVGDTVAQIEQIFNIFKIILGSFGLIALVVASLGMFNTLTISLLERMKEVALLKLLGTRSADVSLLFMTEALIFGAVGGFGGLLLGFISGEIANLILNIYATRSGGDSVFVFYYPWWFVIFIIVFSLAIGILTGIYPARRAARTISLDVIRYE